jgi:uncharacterized integral membrane protein
VRGHRRAMHEVPSPQVLFLVLVDVSVIFPPPAATEERNMDPESRSEQKVTREPRGESIRRHARRTWIYTWAGALVALLVILIALVVANTRTVEVSWVLGSTRQSLVWIILAAAILGWLLGIVTSVIIRRRTRRTSDRPARSSAGTCRSRRAHRQTRPRRHPGASARPRPVRNMNRARTGACSRTSSSSSALDGDSASSSRARTRCFSAADPAWCNRL